MNKLELKGVVKFCGLTVWEQFITKIRRQVLPTLSPRPKGREEGNGYKKVNSLPK